MIKKLFRRKFQSIRRPFIDKKAKGIESELAKVIRSLDIRREKLLA